MGFHPILGFQWFLQEFKKKYIHLEAEKQQNHKRISTREDQIFRKLFTSLRNRLTRITSV